jgi:hypothetical protein
MPSKSFGKCPPGVVCLSPGIVGVALGAILIAAILIYKIMEPPRVIVQAPQMPASLPAAPVDPPVQIVSVAQEGGDDRYTRAPKPERHWITRPDLPTGAEIYGKLPRVPTRGLPETYQSMGVVKMEDGAMLPLYGRRTASRSDRFQYYTRTDSYNPVQLPVSYKRRDCQDDVGCEELFDGESIQVTPTGQRGQVTIYRFDGPTYVPGVL